MRGESAGGLVHIGSGGFRVRVSFCVCCVLRCRPFACCPVLLIGDWVEIWLRLHSTSNNMQTINHGVIAVAQKQLAVSETATPTFSLTITII